MMVMHAVCEGCGFKVPAEEHPSTWPSYSENGKERRCCSRACVLNTFGPETPSTRRPYGLTDRQVQILEQIALGRSNKEIAAELGVAEQTVRNALATVFHKLGALDRLQAVLIAASEGALNLNMLADRAAARLGAERV